MVKKADAQKNNMDTKEQKRIIRERVCKVKYPRCTPEFLELYVHKQYQRIRFADVLLTMNDLTFLMRVHPRQGKVMRKTHGQGDHKILWDLCRDDLDKQSREVHSFIVSLY